MIPRRTLLKQLGAAGAGLAAGAVGAAAAPGGRCGPGLASGGQPNILFIIADQFRADAMGCAGNPDVRTPTLDWLAGSGVRFEQAYCATPVCVPARVSLITGQYPHTNGCKDNSMRWSKNAPTLPELLAPADYERVAVGKRHFGRPHAEALGFGRIVDVRDKGLLQHDEYRAHVERAGLLERVPTGKAHWQESLLGAASPLPEEHYVDAYIGQRAIGELERLAGRDAPWFMWVGFPSPHPPTDPPEPWASMYDADALTVPSFDASQLDTKPAVHAQQRMRRRFIQRGGQAGETEASTRRFLKHYYGLVSLVDHWVGRLLAALEATGQADNTLVVFTSDHGAFAGDHGALFKGFALYDCLAKIPLLLHWPGTLPAGTVVGAPTEHVDLLPTLLQAAGLAQPWGTQGHSLLPLLTGTGPAARDHAFAEYHYQKMIRRGRYKLIEHVGQPLGELYDLASDPGERHNLYRAPAYADVRQALRDTLLERLVDSENPGAPFRPDFSNAGAYLNDPARGAR